MPRVTQPGGRANELGFEPGQSEAEDWACDQEIEGEKGGRTGDQARPGWVGEWEPCWRAGQA